MQSNNYWSSTVNSGSNYWNVNLNNGNWNNNDANNNNYARAVFACRNDTVKALK